MYVSNNHAYVIDLPYYSLTPPIVTEAYVNPPPPSRSTFTNQNLHIHNNITRTQNILEIIKCIQQQEQ